MADSPNVSVVRRLYQARGNPEVIRQVLGSDVRWEVVDGFPYGAIYEGLDSVLRDFLWSPLQGLRRIRRERLRILRVRRNGSRAPVDAFLVDGAVHEPLTVPHIPIPI